MNLDKIVSELKSERDRLDRAIAALGDGAGAAARVVRRMAGGAAAPKGAKGITAAGRRRLSEAMKARWAARKSKSTAKPRATSAATTTSVAKKRGMTAAARKRISAAMKKRWAEKKKASGRKQGAESASTA